MIDNLELLYSKTLGYGPLIVNVVTYFGNAIIYDGDAIAVIPEEGICEDGSPVI